MTHLCVITPITIHPAFVRARPLRFRHEGGKVIRTTNWGEEALPAEELLQLVQELATAADGLSFEAIRAAEDKRLLDAAWDQYHDFWAVAHACTGGAA